MPRNPLGHISARPSRTASQVLSMNRKSFSRYAEKRIGALHFLSALLGGRCGRLRRAPHRSWKHAARARNESGRRFDLVEPAALLVTAHLALSVARVDGAHVDRLLRMTRAERPGDSQCISREPVRIVGELSGRRLSLRCCLFSFRFEQSCCS